MLAHMSNGCHIHMSLCLTICMFRYLAHSECQREEVIVLVHRVCRTAYKKKDKPKNIAV